MNEVGVGTRVFNFVVDTVLVSLIAYGFFKWYVFYVMYYNYAPLQYYIFFYATLFGYYFLFESLLNRTPGKYLTMTRVRTKTGKWAPFYLVFIRSILRLTLIDAFFLPILGRPLHDALSNTRVVEA